VLLLGKLVILCEIQGEFCSSLVVVQERCFANLYTYIICCNLIIIVIELISLFKRLTTGRWVF